MKTQNQHCDSHQNPSLLNNLNPKPNPNPQDSSQYNYPHQFRTAYGPKLIVKTDVSGQDRTKQAFKAECDINQIMARYQKTGVLDFAAKHEPQYADCTGADFQRGMEIIANAKSMFEDMPSRLRLRFENDPAKFLDFVQNPENREEARELGLLKPEPKPATPLQAPSPDVQPDAPLNRAAVRKAAREAADLKESRDDKDHMPT